MTSSWSSRFNLGRFSPFSARGEPAPKVQDSDFSYITDAEINAAADRAPPGEPRPPKDTDVLIFKYQRTNYPIHFPAYAIDEGTLSVPQAKEAIARKISADPRRIRLFCRGKKFEGTGTLYAQGLRSSQDAPEILTILSDAADEEYDDEDEDEDDGDEDGASKPGGGAAGKKKRRNRKRKTKRGAGGSGEGSGASTPVAEHLPVPSGTHPLHKDRDGRAASPLQQQQQQSQQPTTPQGKLQVLVDKLRGELVPMCERYIQSPPAEKDKRDFEYKRITETILAQVLLKTDAVETEGDEDARAMRKALVKEAQGWLNRMDEAKG